MPNFIPFRANETIVASDLIDAYRGFCGLGEDKLPRDENGDVTTDLINIGSESNPYNELYVNSVNSDIFNTSQSFNVDGAPRNVYADTGVLDFHYSPTARPVGNTETLYDSLISIKTILGNSDIINNFLDTKSLLSHTIYFFFTRYIDADLITGDEIDIAAFSDPEGDDPDRMIRARTDVSESTVETDEENGGVFRTAITDHYIQNFPLTERVYETLPVDIAGNEAARALIRLAVTDPESESGSATGRPVMITPQAIDGENVTDNLSNYNSWLAHRTLSKVRIILM